MCSLFVSRYFGCQDQLCCCRFVLLYCCLIQEDVLAVLYFLCYAVFGRVFSGDASLL
jgi:hypothetical protein